MWGVVHVLTSSSAGLRAQRACGKERACTGVGLWRRPGVDQRRTEPAQLLAFVSPFLKATLDTSPFPRPFPSLPFQAVRGNVLSVLEQKDQRSVKEALMRDLDLEQVRVLGAGVCLGGLW